MLAEARRCSTTGGTTENGVSGRRSWTPRNGPRRRTSRRTTSWRMPSSGRAAQAPTGRAARRRRGRHDDRASSRASRVCASCSGKTLLFGNQFGRRPCERAFASLVNAAYVAESRAAAAAAAAAFEEGARATRAARGWLASVRRSGSEALRACARLAEPHDASDASESLASCSLRAFLRGDESLLRWRVKRASRKSGGASARARRRRRVWRRRRSARGVHALRYRDFGIHMRISASAAALESTMLFGRGGGRWLESVRGDARGAVALAAGPARQRRRRPPNQGCGFGARSSRASVSLATTEDIVPSMSHLFSWPPAAHAVRRAGSGAGPRPRVVKRYSDFAGGGEKGVPPRWARLALPPAPPSRGPATPRWCRRGACVCSDTWTCSRRAGARRRRGCSRRF